MSVLPGTSKYCEEIHDSETDKLTLDILQMIRKQMGLDATYEIDLDVTADTIGADSLDQIELLMSLEDHFNLDECIDTNFKGTTLRELVQYVRTAKRIKKLHTPLNPQHFLDDAVYVRELASHNPGKLVLGIQTTLSEKRSISKEHGHVMVMPHSSFCVYQYGETVLDTQDFHLAVKKYNELLNTSVVPVP